MNTIYKTVISRDEFINLYRFGMININRNFLLKESNNIENNLIELFKILSFNEASDYLILTITDEFYNESFKNNTYMLKLENMKRVEVLSEKAERFYRTKVNSKITYDLTEYRNILSTIETYQELNDMNRGVEILFEQFNINSELEIEENFPKNLLKLIKEDNYLNNAYKNFNFDLLTYRRENKFNKEDKGFIYDLMIIAILKDRKDERISKFKQGLLHLDSSPAYTTLNEQKKEKLIDYISFIVDSDNENIKKFLEKLGKENLIIGSVFLKVKNLLENKEENQNYWNDVKCVIDDFNKEYPTELKMALYFIGLIFGYKELYDDYYDFIKDKKEKAKLEEEVQAKAKELQSKKEALAKFQSEKDNSETKAKEELEKLKSEKDSKIKELKEKNNIAEKEKAKFEEEVQAKAKELQSEKEALEKLKSEKDSKIKELKEKNNIAEKEKAKFEEEVQAKAKELQSEKEALEKLKSEKDSKIKELKEPNINTQKNKIEVNSLVTKKITTDEILKDIEDTDILKNISKKLGLTSKAKTTNGLKTAIRKYSDTQEKLQNLSEIVENLNLPRQGELELCS